jgi:arginine-tRNA-protein transferase
VLQANAGVVRLEIGRPSVSREKLALYDRYHAHQSDFRDWPRHPPRDATSYADAYVRQPFPVEEWCYYLNDCLVGVGYVDALPSEDDKVRRWQGDKVTEAAASSSVTLSPSHLVTLSGVGGLSAIYFFYEPEERQRSLGTWNVLSLIDEANHRGLPYVYLGYYVEGSRSMEYKGRFAPSELRGDDGVWRAFRQ